MYTSPNCTQAQRVRKQTLYYVVTPECQVELGRRLHTAYYTLCTTADRDCILHTWYHVMHTAYQLISFDFRIFLGLQHLCVTTDSLTRVNVRQQQPHQPGILHTAQCIPAYCIPAKTHVHIRARSRSKYHTHIAQKHEFSTFLNLAADVSLHFLNLIRKYSEYCSDGRAKSGLS